MRPLLSAVIALSMTLLCYCSQAQDRRPDTTAHKEDTIKASATAPASASPSAPTPASAAPASTTPASAAPASTAPTSNAPASTVQEDDEFNMFLLALGTAFVCIVLGATLAGSMLATLFLLSVFLLVSAGVLSVGVLVGFYRRSIAAGFRTVLMIVCIGGGMACGAVAFWLINRIFDIHLQPPTALLIGAFSGLVGGLLLGLVLFTIIRLFLNYCRKKMAF